MLDQISKIIEQVGAKEAAEKGVSSDMMSKVTDETKDSIVSGFKNAVSDGNIQQITDLFQGDSSASALTSNPMVSGMISNLISKLTGNIGMDSGTYKNLETAVIAKILRMIILKRKISR